MKETALLLLFLVSVSHVSAFDGLDKEVGKRARFWRGVEKLKSATFERTGLNLGKPINRLAKVTRAEKKSFLFGQTKEEVFVSYKGVMVSASDSDFQLTMSEREGTGELRFHPGVDGERKATYSGEAELMSYGEVRENFRQGQTLNSEDDFDMMGPDRPVTTCVFGRFSVTFIRPPTSVTDVKVEGRITEGDECVTKEGNVMALVFVIKLRGNDNFMMGKDFSYPLSEVELIEVRQIKGDDLASYASEYVSMHPENESECQQIHRHALGKNRCINAAGNQASRHMDSENFVSRAVSTEGGTLLLQGCVKERIDLNYAKVGVLVERAENMADAAKKVLGIEADAEGLGNHFEKLADANGITISPEPTEGRYLEVGIAYDITVLPTLGVIEPSTGSRFQWDGATCDVAVDGKEVSPVNSNLSFSMVARDTRMFCVDYNQS